MYCPRKVYHNVCMTYSLKLLQLHVQSDSFLYSPSLDHFNINESTVAELGENAHRDFDNETESKFTF